VDLIDGGLTFNKDKVSPRQQNNKLVKLSLNDTEIKSTIVNITRLKQN